MSENTSAKVNAADLQELKSSEFFDPDWYLEQYPDVAFLDMSPAEHFLWLGGRLGRNPSPRFDSKSYLSARPELVATGGNPLLHYLRQGETGETPVPGYGKTFAGQVEAKVARSATSGQSDIYDVLRTEFDVPYYLMRYPDVGRAKDQDPILHYMRNGWREERDPSPNFSTKQYLERYPEVADSGHNPFYHWLVIGRARGYIAERFPRFEIMCEMLGRSPAEAQKLLHDQRDDLRKRLEHGELGRMVAKAAEHEPLIAHSWPEALRVRTPPFFTEPVVDAVVSLYLLQKAAQFRRADYVIVVNRPRWGGGVKDEGYLARALLKNHPGAEILIVYSEEGGKAPPNRFPEACSQVDFATVTEDLAPRDRETVFLQFLRSLRPRAVFSVNSRLFWDTLTPYGKALSAEIPLYTYLFCNEQTPFGYWTGYPLKFFYRHFDKLAGVLVDSHFLKDELEKLYRVPGPQAKAITVLSAPVDERVKLIQPVEKEGPPKVFWAGRFDRQKRLDVAYEIARSMPDVEFHLWGKSMLDGYDMESNKPSNIHLEGVYDDFLDLPLETCDAWLYTSEWDGVPHMLLEVAMTGIPLVGSLVGGNHEVLLEGMSWPVHDFENPIEYQQALRDIFSDPTTARSKALQLRETLIEQRTADNYAKSVADALSIEALRGVAPA